MEKLALYKYKYIIFCVKEIENTPGNKLYYYVNIYINYFIICKIFNGTVSTGSVLHWDTIILLIIM